MFSMSLRAHIRRWELLLLTGLAAALLLGAGLEREQSDLADQVLRLHILANSDSTEDQQLKLKVRDRILQEADDLLPDTATREDAVRILQENLPRLAQAGAETAAWEGYAYSVSAELRETWFPTKQYDGFALPAGTYQALRIVIGEGAGRNWWCVVFPPLCLNSAAGSVETAAQQAGMTEQQVALLTADTEGYVIKFKALELWDRVKQLF